MAESDSDDDGDSEEGEGESGEGQTPRWRIVEVGGEEWAIRV
jgi:hypothetical protein